MTQISYYKRLSFGVFMAALTMRTGQCSALRFSGWHAILGLGIVSGMSARTRAPKSMYALSDTIETAKFAPRPIWATHDPLTDLFTHDPLTTIYLSTISAAGDAKSIPMSLPTATTVIDYSCGAHNTNTYDLCPSTWSDDMYTGAIPTELGLLSKLTRLALGDNKLFGPVPTQLGNLRKMIATISVWKNSITSTVPSEIGKLHKLSSVLEWGSNHLSGSIPTELGNMVSFYSGFNLYSNRLFGSLPTELGKLANMLAMFAPSSNSLTGSIPTELGNMVKLTSGLHLFSNSFSSTIPSQLGKLDSMLNEFTLHSNSLVGSIPTELGRQVKMGEGTAAGWYLLKTNSLSGAIPTQLGNLGRLRSFLELSSNRLSSAIPTELGQLTRLIDYLGLSVNSLTSKVPSELGRLTKLTSFFFLQDNKLNAAIPSELGNLVQLSTTFYLSSNKLTGPVPTELGRLRRMEMKFDLAINKLYSSIPTELGNLAEMSSLLYLYDNELTSTIPTELGRLDKMSFYFQLEINSLSGAVPTELGRMSMMHERFSMWENQFSASIPTEVGNLVSMTSKLFISNAQITSAIPTEIGRLTKMTSFLYLNNNALTSAIPTEMGRLLEMTTRLLLYNNALSGAIPTELGRLVKMERNFQLDRNKLSSGIPSQFGNLINLLELFSLNSNALSSTIPTQLGMLGNMNKGFRLSCNSVSSVIPSELGALTGMTEDFDLSANELCGALPTQMQALSSVISSEVLLTTDTSVGTVCGWIEDTRFPSAGDTSTTVLDLGGQQLEGMIPTEIGLLVKVSQLDFGECLLSGSIPTELGALVELAEAFILGKNDLSSSVPTEVGKLGKLTKDFQLYSNRRLCGNIPTQVQALSSSAAFGWRLASGTSIGTTCGLPSDDGDDDSGEDSGEGQGDGDGLSIGAASYLAVTVASLLALAMTCTVLARLRFLRTDANYYSQAFGGQHRLLEEWDSSSGTRSVNHGYLELPANQWDDTLVLHEDGYFRDGDPLFRSWKNSRWLIAIFDQDLKVVLWSKGLEQACAFTPVVGTDLASFPFASPQQRAMMIKALSKLHDAETAPMFPDRAMHAAMLAEPNVFMHLVPALGGTAPLRSVAISMTAVLIYPIQQDGVARPLQEVSHVLVMGQDQLDPALTSLWVGSDVTSELTSETGSASGRMNAEKSDVIGDKIGGSGDGGIGAVAAGQLASLSSSSSEGPGAGGGYADFATLDRISSNNDAPGGRTSAGDSGKRTLASLGAIPEERGGEEPFRERFLSSQISVQSDTLQMTYSLFRSEENRVLQDSMTVLGRAGDVIGNLYGDGSSGLDVAESLVEDGSIDSRANSGGVSSAYFGNSSGNGSTFTGASDESTASDWTWALQSSNASTQVLSKAEVRAKDVAGKGQAHLEPFLNGAAAGKSGSFDGSRGRGVEAMDETTVGVERSHRDARSVTTQSATSGGDMSGLSVASGEGTSELSAELRASAVRIARSRQRAGLPVQWSPTAHHQGSSASF